MPRLRCFSILLLALVAHGAAADTLLTFTRDTPEITFEGRTRGGHQTITALAGPGRLRLEEPDRTVILREDQGKLYIVHPIAKSWSVVKLPLHLQAELPKDMYQAIWGDLQGPPPQATASDTQRTKSVGTWKSAEHRIQVTSPAGGQPATAVVWTTGTLDPAPFVLLQKVERLLAAMSPRPERILLEEEIGKLPGAAVEIDRTLNDLNGPADIRWRLVSVGARDAGPADYEPPKDLKKQDFFWLYLRLYREMW